MYAPDFEDSYLCKILRRMLAQFLQVGMAHPGHDDTTPFAPPGLISMSWSKHEIYVLRRLEKFSRLLQARDGFGMLVAAPLGDSLRKFCEVALETGGSFLGTALDLTYLHCRNSISNGCGRKDNYWRSRPLRNSKCQARHSVSLLWAGWHQQWKRSEQGVMP